MIPDFLELDVQNEEFDWRNCVRVLCREYEPRKVEKRFLWWRWTATERFYTETPRNFLDRAIREAAEYAKSDEIRERFGKVEGMRLTHRDWETSSYRVVWKNGVILL